MRAAVTSRCVWSALKTYDVNARGQNHGVLFATRGWTPWYAAGCPAKAW